MKRFNLDKWLEDKSRKVIDDDGFPVEIIKWDANEKCPVVYLNHNGIAYNVSVDGMYDTDPNHGLFFADEEDKTDEFKETMISFVHAMFDHLLDINKEVNVEEWEDKLLDLARKEIEKENQYGGKQKKKWSKEDEENRIDAIKYLELFDAQCIHGDVATHCINWLKSIRDRV